jgi:sugar-specific transcriptional regulator TrmB
MDLKPLEEIGLTESEIRVYLALLRLGQSTAGPIVDEAKVTRSKIYDILERLKNKGLVSYVIRESTKYFGAADPRSIMSYLDEKEKKIEKEKDSIKNILPELISQYTKGGENKTAEIFIGMKGMENAFNVLVEEFDKNERFYAFGAGKGEDVEKIQIFFNRLHLKRVEKKVKTSIIFTEESRGLRWPESESELLPTITARPMFQRASATPDPKSATSHR